MEEVVGWLMALIGGVFGGAIGFILIALGVGVAFMPLLMDFRAGKPATSARSSRV